MNKRFFYKMYTSGEVTFFDNEQEYVDERYTCDGVRGLHPMDYWEVEELLNELVYENGQLQEEIKRLEKMIWKIQWRFQQEVGIEKAREHYQEIDKEMEE